VTKAVKPNVNIVFKVTYEQRPERAEKFAASVGRHYSVKVLRDLNRKRTTVTVSDAHDLTDANFILREYERLPDEAPLPLLEGEEEADGHED